LISTYLDRFFLIGEVEYRPGDKTVAYFDSDITSDFLRQPSDERWIFKNIIRFRE
jgi:hypothetical protein